VGVFHHRVCYPRSRSGSVGRVALSREDKEAAKLGLSVFTVITPKYAGISWWGGSRSEHLFQLRATRQAVFGEALPASGWFFPVGMPGHTARPQSGISRQHHRVESSRPGTSLALAKKKLRSEEKVEPG